MKAHEILNNAAGHLKDRASTYDKPEGERSMQAAVDAMRAVSGVSMTAEQGWLFMALLKAVRTQQGGYRADNYEDGSAYFALAGEQASFDRVDAVPRHEATPNVLEFDEARADAIGQNGNDGLHYAEDMTDPANWRAGDIVECVSPPDYNNSPLRRGNMYKLIKAGIAYVYLDGGDENVGWYPSRFRFHSRPSK